MMFSECPAPKTKTYSPTWFLGVRLRGEMVTNPLLDLLE